MSVVNFRNIIIKISIFSLSETDLYVFCWNIVHKNIFKWENLNNNKFC